MGKDHSSSSPHFEKLTREVSSSSASASDVIPIVSVFKRVLTQENEANEGIKTMKGTILEAVNTETWNLSHYNRLLCYWI